MRDPKWDTKFYLGDKSASVKYMEDSTFRAVVDQMYAVLSYHLITPSELRQAAILAATMYEQRTLKPLLIYYDECPAMFGGVSGRTQSAVPNVSNTPKGKTDSLLQSSTLDYLRDRLVDAKEKDKAYGDQPANAGKTVTDRRNAGVKDRRKRPAYMAEDEQDSPRFGKFERHQGAYKEKGFSLNGDRRKKGHTHIFTLVHGRKYKVCACGISETYYEYTLNSTRPTPPKP